SVYFVSKPWPISKCASDFYAERRNDQPMRERSGHLVESPYRRPSAGATQEVSGMDAARVRVGPWTAHPWGAPSYGLRSSTGAREVWPRSGQTRMSGWPSLWLLSLGPGGDPQARESNSPSGRKGEVATETNRSIKSVRPRLFTAVIDIRKAANSRQVACLDHDRLGEHVSQTCPRLHEYPNPIDEQRCPGVTGERLGNAAAFTSIAIDRCDAQ